MTEHCYVCGKPAWTAHAYLGAWIWYCLNHNPGRRA